MCDGNVKQTILFLSVCECVCVCVGVLAKMQLFHCHNCCSNCHSLSLCLSKFQLLLQLQLQLKLQLQLPFAIVADFIGRLLLLRKPEVVNIQAKTRTHTHSCIVERLMSMVTMPCISYLPPTITLAPTDVAHM